MKRLRNTNQIPPGGFEHIQPETKVVFRINVWVSLISKIRQHCEAMGLPIGSQFEERIHEENCNRIRKLVDDRQYHQICEDTDPPTLAQQVSHFWNSMVEWKNSGFKVVTHEQFLERKAICSGSEDGATKPCPEWKRSPAFGFTMCGKCSCTSLKLFVRTEKCPLNKWPTI